MTGTGSADATPSRLRYAFLGPAGTFTEAALRKVADPAEAEFVSAGSVLSAVAALRRGEVDRAVVPIENSVEGGVSATVDEIALGETLQILAEVHVPISFVLVGRPGVAMEDVRRVTTHPHAWAQVRGWAETALPGVEFTPAPSTAAGAGLVAQGDFDAAVCAPLVAEQTGLPVLAERIEDVPGAVTRFVLLSRPTALPAPTGADKTTLVVPLPEDRPGALGQILAEFTTRGVNLSRIESRPTGEGIGRYFFSLDLEGHLAEARVGDALAALYREYPDLRFLGPYAQAEPVPTRVPAEFTDAAYRSGRAWVESLRSR